MMRLYYGELHGEPNPYKQHSEHACLDNVYTVWTNQSTGIKEPCALNPTKRCYVGLHTGTEYSQHSHYHSPRVRGIILEAKAEHNTGMSHLSEPDANDKRGQWIGCLVSLEVAHHYGEHLVYRAYVGEKLLDYFHESEVQLLHLESVCVTMGLL